MFIGSLILNIYSRVEMMTLSGLFSKLTKIYFLHSNIQILVISTFYAKFHYYKTFKNIFLEELDINI